MTQPHKPVIDHYQAYDEDARFTSRHGMVEFLTTLRYIDRYLKPGDRVLEIGAASGRYSHHLAQAGYLVDAVELVPHNIDVFRENTKPGECVTIVQGDALDLAAFADDTYDLTLLLGPLYHLFTLDEKRRAVCEAIRVTKPGGVIFAAHVISDGCILDEGFARKAIDVPGYIAKGFIDPETFAVSVSPEEIFDLVRKEEIDEVMRGLPVTRLHYVAADGYSQCIREAVDAMDDATFDLYLRYHFATCERPDMVGMTAHALDVFRKDSRVGFEMPG